jgi:membrane protease YdiL (CAAX protease family)
MATGRIWNNCRHDKQRLPDSRPFATLLFRSRHTPEHPGMTTMTRKLHLLATDWQFYLVIAGTIATGIGLWLWLPAGYAQSIASDPWLLVSFLLLYPLVEEWVFRGILQGELLKREWGKRRGIGISNANLITSVVFTGLHFINQPPLWALLVLGPSLLLGHFRERHDSLLPPMLLHPLFNLAYLVAGL